ncbi:hypothetical protein QVZ41_14380 [Wenyingzhuangia sp. chi5]|uniref:Lipoprotein n=1 Tax=Wenyingzhuangia gilva TaxID=3057677 RepID=A0ABT8VVN3_9FLAO|nr:hypothetical protein [Wenyingzhuangia sp. chi5]MDO3696036.1 hypothetical protein [Wenyingzhuangia sp. chi5]
MVRNIIFLLFISLLIQCNSESKKHKTEWIKIEHSRDINDFSDYLSKYPYSRYFQKSVERYLILSDSLFNINEYAPCQKNNISVNQIDSLNVLFYHEITPIDSLKQKTFEYLIAERVNSSTYKHQIPNSDKKTNLSTGFISISIDSNNVDYNQLKNTVYEISKGVEKYKSYLTTKFYNKKLHELDIKTQNEINNLIGTRLGFHKYIEYRMPPPPPPYENNLKDSEHFIIIEE